jgi:tetratricopeptide (TPR) repeat protein
VKDIFIHSYIEFANELFDQGDYHAAIVEYKRAIHFSEDCEEVASAQFKIALGFQRLDEWSKAVQWFEKVRDRNWVVQENINMEKLA